MAETSPRPRGRFLLATTDVGGTLPPALGLAAELVRRGHSVLVLSDPLSEEAVRTAGCDFRPWQLAQHIDTIDQQTALMVEMEKGNGLQQLRAARDLFIVGPAAGFAAEVVATVREHPVDVVLSDGVPGMLIGAQATGRPTAALMANIYLRPTPGMPLMALGWLPPRGPLGRARDAVIRRATGLVLDRFTRGLNPALAANGRPPVRGVFELFDRCTEVLVLTSPSFDFSSPHIPANVHFVGPQLDDPAWAGDAGDWRPPGDAPLVLVATSSTFQDQLDLLRRVATALGELPVRGLITAGRAVDPADVAAPANVRVVRAAPHRAVLPEAAAVVTHAGHGSVLKALAAGVPLVCMPMGRDQKDNTVRVLRLGAGVRVDEKAPPERIAAAVRQVLDEPGYADAARRFAETLATEAKTRPSAADRAEGLLIG
ncbi:nucleotide disphospho-sugar-binding domain-containing protein [Petropleomorpha daqingensis]|uniref:UDP:flavonoid glycosyltransferase YjiC (YdhE family) n=1 Tax=Petropleomorpha daqingensis TaxID=2026353 RepID=A0A853CG95_9ACTN|nr:nucleotide disphospho-sugar-binding domain-containing protein [Petropleomorpha daqingensis]NYJ06019.1 UDP:flavonoid glycosyltransferase YjiC (YdhE family) [Petropleomorpha daqingensis]